MRTEIAIISALALVLSVPVAFGEIVETKGQNYDLVENYFIGEAIWNSHPERIMDNGWKNYALTNTGEKVIFNTNAVGSFVFDKNSCSYSIYENGYNGQQVIPSVSAVASYLDNGVWSNLPVNDEACTVKVTEYEDGVFLTSTKVITTDLMENVFIDYTGTTQNFYSNSTNANFDLVQFSNGTNQGYFNGETRVIESFEVEKFVQEIRLDIRDGFKETFKVWNDGNQELGISQTIHSGDSITIGETVIDIAELNGQSFDKQFIIDNKAEILAITDSVNYDFDTGIESLTNVNIIFEDNTYKVNMDYASGDFVGYLEIDPTFNTSVSTNGHIRHLPYQSGSSCGAWNDNSSWTGLERASSSRTDACRVNYVEWDTSDISADATINKIELTYDITALGSWSGVDDWEINPMTIQPSVTSSATDIGNDAEDGTAYASFVGSSTAVANGIVTDLGTQAITDLQNNSNEWFAVGIGFESYVRSGFHANLSFTVPTLEVTYSFPVAPTVAPTGLTASTGVPIELDWNTIPSSGDGGSAITAYNVYRSLEEYAQQDLPNNSANANGIDFTNNELLLHGIETTTDTPTATYSDFTGTWTTDSGNEVQASNGVVSVNMGGSNRNDYISFDLGTPLSDSWVLRFKQEATTNSFTLNSGNAGAMYVSLSDGTNLSGEHNDGGSVDSLMTRVRHDSTQWKVETFDVRSRVSGTTTSSGDAGQVLATGAQTYYVEMIKDGATTSVKYFDDSAFTSQVGTTKSVSSNSIGTNLQYLGVHIYSQSHSSGDFIAEVSEFEIYDGITSTESVTTVSLPDKSTNSIPITLGTSGGVSISGFDNTWVASRSQASVSGGTLSFNTQTDGTNTSISYDLGSPLSDTWSIRAKISVPSQGHNSVGYAQGVYFGLSSADSGTGSTVAQDFVGMKYMHDNIDRPLGAVHADDEHLEVTRDNMGSYGVQFGSNISANTVMYIEIERVSADTYNVTHYSDSGYTSVVSSITVTMSVTPEGLQYIVFRNIDENVSQSGGETLTIEDISFEVAGSTSTTSTTGVISTGVQSPNLVYTNSNIPDNTDDFSIGGWVKLDPPTPPTYENDFSTDNMIDQNSAKIGISNNVLDVDGDRGSFNHASSWDIGNTLSDTEWVLRYKMTVDTLDTTGDTVRLYMGMSSLSSSSDSNQAHDFIGFHGKTSASEWKAMDTNGASMDIEGTAFGTIATGDYFVEIIRKSATTYSVTVTTNSDFTGGDTFDSTLGSGQNSSGGAGTVDLKYFWVGNVNAGGNNNADLQVTIDDMQIYNGVSSVPVYDPNTKLLGLNDVTFNVGTDSASVDSLGQGTALSEIDNYARYWEQGGSSGTSNSNQDCSLKSGSNPVRSTHSSGTQSAYLAHTGNSYSGCAMGFAEYDVSGYSNWSTTKTIDIEFDITDISSNVNPATYGYECAVRPMSGSTNPITDSDTRAVWTEMLEQTEQVTWACDYSTSSTQTNKVITLPESFVDVLTSDTDGKITIAFVLADGSGNFHRPTSASNGMGYWLSTTHTDWGLTPTLASPIISATGLTDNTSTPQHYSFTRSGNDFVIYQNGASVATATDSTSLGSNGEQISVPSGSAYHQDFSSYSATGILNNAWDESSDSSFTHTQQSACDNADWTAIMWYKSNDSTDTTSLDTIWAWNSGDKSARLVVQNDKIGVGVYGGTAGNTWNQQYSNSLGDNQWHQVAVVNDGSTQTYEMFVDGTSDHSGTSDNYWMSNSCFKLDQVASATSSNNGYYLDEFSYHNSKLTQAEIQATKSSPDYTTNIDGMIDEFFIDSSALTSTEIDHIYDRGDKGTLVTTTSASTTEYDDSSVVGGNNYYFSVAGVNAIGEGVAITPYVSGLAGTPPQSPTSIATTISSPDSTPLAVTLSWSAPTNVGTGTLTGFEIYRDGTLIDTVGLVTSYADTVSSVGTYVYSLKAISTHGTSGLSSTSSIDTPTAPPTPDAPTLGITSPDPSPFDVTVSWSAQSDGGSAITGYEIFRSATETGTYSSVGTVNDLDFTDTVPSIGTWYYKITSTNLLGTSGQSVSSNVATPNAPDAPSITLSIADTDAFPRTITATFVAPSNNGGSAITGYNLEYSEDDSSYTQIQSNINGSFDYTVASAGTHYFKAQAINNAGTGVLSTGYSIATPNVPDAPSITLAINDTDEAPRTITATFVAPSSDGGSALTGYNLFTSPDDSVFTQVATGVNGNFNSTVASAGTWYLMAQAVNNVGTSLNSTSVSIATPNTPDAPSLTLAINDPDNSPLTITSTFVAPSSDGGSALTGYNLYSSPDDSVYTPIAEGVNGNFNSTVASAGTWYFKSEAINNVGNGTLSSSFNIATPTIPDAPSITLSIDNPDPSPFDVTATFVAPSSDGGSALIDYNLYYSSDNVLFSSIVNATVTPFTYDVVTAGTHYFKAEVTNNVGTSLNSTSVSVATPTVPPAPASATSTIPDINTAPYGVTVTWTTPTATGGSALTEYNVYRQTGSGTFSLVATTTSLTLSDTVSSISDQDFTYKIHAVNNVGEGTAFVTTTVTTGDVPDAPVLSGTSGTTSLTWTTPASDASITGYKIFRDGNLVTTVSGNSHSDFTTISFGSTYVYTVKAVSFFGDSVSSNQFSTTPETEITGMIAQGITGTGAVIDWDEPAYYQGQITNYEVYYSEITASVTTPTTSAGTTTNTYSNFAPTLDYDTTYIFGVKIISPLGNSGFSNYVTVTTSVDGSIVAYDPTTGTIDWFDIDSVSEQTVNVIEFQRETQTINGTATDTLQVAYPSWWDDMTCDVDYKFAQKTEQYTEGDDMTAQVNSADANQQVIGFAFQDIDNEVIEVECAPQQSQQDDEVSAKYIMTQQTLGDLQADGTYSSGIPSIPLVAQIQAFQTGEYGTDGSFGALDVVGLFVILISMVGFNRVSPIVGVLLSASLVFALSFFGIISLPTVLVGVVALVIFLAWGIQRNR